MGLAVLKLIGDMISGFDVQNYNLRQNCWHKPPFPRTMLIWSRVLSSLSSKLPVEYGKRLLQHCSGGRGATDTLFHNKRDLFRKFGGLLSMRQQVLSKIVASCEWMVSHVYFFLQWTTPSKWRFMPRTTCPSCSTCTLVRQRKATQTNCQYWRRSELTSP